MAIVFFKFIVCMCIVVAAGYYLSVTADTIADKKGFSKTWVGIVLLASVTSLPELVTCISAIKSPDLALGNIFGSNTINTVIIAVMDFLSKGAPILGVVSVGHILSAGFGLLLTGVAAFAIILRAQFGDVMNVGMVGVESIGIVIVYLAGMRLIFTYEKEEDPSPQFMGGNEKEAISLRKEYLIVFLSAFLVIGAGAWLAYLGDEIAYITGWGKTFVGSMFLAFATSLPEIVVCLSAVKIKSFDMGVGNILGSSFFNIAIIPVLDIVYRSGTILSSVSPEHIFTALLFIIMTSIVIIAIIFRTKRNSEVANYEIWIVTLCYLAGSYLLFTTIH